MTPRGSNILTRVEELINPVDGTWDEELINDIFWPIDVHRILQIHLTPDREDFVAWHHNNSGMFSVKSAYYCQWNYKFGRNHRNENIAEGANNSVWEKLWSLEIPSKIKKNWLESATCYDPMPGCACKPAYWQSGRLSYLRRWLRRYKTYVVHL
jgi:hypothetical protein